MTTCGYDTSLYSMKAYTPYRMTRLVIQVDKNYADLNCISEPLFLVPLPPKD